MLMKVYSIFDTKTEAYMQPFFCLQAGQAIRSFTDAVQDSSSMIGKHPSDFVLFEIGTYDDQNGSLVPYSALKSLGCGIEFVTKV